MNQPNREEWRGTGRSRYRCGPWVRAELVWIVMEIMAELTRTIATLRLNLTKC